MKFLIRLGLLLVVGILIYNYFLGTPEEKEQSRTIFRQVKELSKETWSLLRVEKQKLDAGKYDTTIDRIGSIYDQLRARAESGQDLETLRRIQELERQRQSLQQEMDNLRQETSTGTQKRSFSSPADSSREEARLKDSLRELLRETEVLMKDMEGQ